jgi:hypothetical protein
MRLEPTQQVISAQVWVCHDCGAQDHKSCGCAGATAYSEALLEKRARDRKYQRDSRDRKKAQENQQARQSDTNVVNIDEFQPAPEASALAQKAAKEAHSAAQAVEMERLASKLIEMDRNAARTIHDLIAFDERVAMNKLMAALACGLGFEMTVATAMTSRRPPRHDCNPPARKGFGIVIKNARAAKGPGQIKGLDSEAYTTAPSSAQP